MKKQASSKNKSSNSKKVTKKSTSKTSGIIKEPAKVQEATLPSAISLIKQSHNLMWGNKGVFIGILAIYAVLQIVLVQGVLVSNFGELRTIFEDSFGGLAGSLATLSYMVTSVGQASTAEAGVYQGLLFVIASLAILWAVRQIHSGKTIRIRDAYYKGMHPLVPYFLVLIVITIQMLPALLGAWLYSIVTANSIASNTLEQGLWIGLFGLLASLSIYMLCSSVLALIVVSLPDVTPIQALRIARSFVKKRRLQIISRAVILIILTLATLSAIMIPVILFMPFLAPIVFHVVTVAIIGFSITYTYHIYRGLIDNGQ